MRVVAPGDDARLNAWVNRASRRLFGSPARRDPGFSATGAIRAYPLTIAAWMVGFAATALVFSTVLVPVTRHSSLHLVLDTVDACVALLAAYLAHQRFRRERDLPDLLLSQALFLLVLAALAPRWLNAVIGEDAAAFVVWLRIAIQFLGTLLILAAALTARDQHGGAVSRLGFRTTWSFVLGVLVLTTAIFWALRAQLPPAVSLDYIPVALDASQLTAHPVLVTVQVGGALAFLVASVAFARHGYRRQDSFLVWLGPACALGAFARVNYAAFPSNYSDFLYMGDFLRTGFYLLLLLGATREISEYWNSRADRAVFEDRRRLARELHDGVIQELGFIRSEVQSLADGPRRERILGASDRALDEARAALMALEETGSGSLASALLTAAAEATRRHGIGLHVDLDHEVSADGSQRYALSRILREAVSNAARHGSAAHVTVRLFYAGDERCLVVADDGGGFEVDTEDRTRSGYGLTSMRERARALPGTFALTSERGQGSVVSIRW